MGGAVYLLFVARKLFGVDGALAWLGDVRGDVLVNVGKWLAGGAVTITALGARFTQTFGKLRVALDAVLDVDNYFRDPANRRPPRARIFSRYAALLDYLRARGYTRLIIVAHSQGTVISADLLRYLHRTGRLAALTGAMPVTLVTVGSPLRDLYAARFPLQYGWMGAPPETFARAEPAPGALGLTEWVNAYRSGDYVGRAIWTPVADAAAFRVAAIADDGAVAAHRAEGRTEFCIGAGAHTHYFADDAVTLAAEIDRLIGAP
jgi:pimeloyl-ACP methyl ester carboxylesterase